MVDVLLSVRHLSISEAKFDKLMLVGGVMTWNFRCMAACMKV